MKKGVAITFVVVLLVIGIFAFKFIGSSDGEFVATADPGFSLATALAKNKPIFIEFYADRCPACVTMKPVVTQLKQQYGDQIEFIFADTDGTGYPLAAEYEVMYIPTYVLINAQGKQVSDNMSGVISKDKLENLLKELL